MFYIQNKHLWTDHKKFEKCEHPHLTNKQVKAKEWLSPKSEAIEALESIVLDKNILEDLTKFCHAGLLEVCHSLYNKWAPKRQYSS